MANIPVGMQRNNRSEDQIFRPDEILYRRVPLILWDNGDDDIEVDAIELPDMSTVRNKYGHPEWTRLGNGDFSEWGVIGFAVQDIPPHLLHLGVFQWDFKPFHAPEKNNYPHSEVRAYEKDKHISAKNNCIDYDLHLRFRELLLRKVIKVIKPYDIVTIRDEPP